MGDSVVSNGNEYQQQKGNRVDIPFISGYLDYLFGKRIKEMVEVKGLLSILNFLGYSLYGYTLFINIDNVKGVILMVIGSLFGVAKLYFYVRKQMLALNRERQEQRQKDFEYNQMLSRQQEQDIVNMQKELDLNIRMLSFKKKEE